MKILSNHVELWSPPSWPRSGPQSGRTARWR